MRRPTWLIGTLFTGVGCWAFADERPVDPRSVIDQLGSRSFSQRIEAEAWLYQSGHRILPLLEAGRTHPSAEVRMRVESLILRVSQSQLGVAIDEFTAEGSVTSLPGWDFVSEVVGDRPETRQVFGELLRNDTDLAGALIRTETLEAEMRRRVMSPTALGRTRDLSRVSALGLLILMTHPDAEHADDSMNTAYYTVRQLYSRSEGTPEDQMKLALMTFWITKPSPKNAQQRLELANRFKLPEGIHPAMEMIDNPRRYPQVNEPFAVIARYGGAEQMAALETRLTNTTVLATSRGEDDKIKSTTELRDLALAALIVMTNQNPADYKLAPFLRDTEGQIRQLSAGFESEEARTAAFQQWKAWSAKNLRKFQPPPDDASEGTPL